MKAVSLVVRRTIPASAERLFAAWTEPAQLVRWWGPRPVVCDAAEVDLRTGGAYRIANRHPDGSVTWIVGEFERVQAPDELVFTWRMDPGPPVTERVTVRFEARDGGTEVIVVHEKIASDAVRTGHEAGWIGCLDGLERHFAPT